MLGDDPSVEGSPDTTIAPGEQVARLAARGMDNRNVLLLNPARTQLGDAVSGSGFWSDLLARSGSSR